MIMAFFRSNCSHSYSKFFSVIMTLNLSPTHSVSYCHTVAFFVKLQITRKGRSSLIQTLNHFTSNIVCLKFSSKWNVNKVSVRLRNYILMKCWNNVLLLFEHWQIKVTLPLKDEWHYKVMVFLPKMSWTCQVLTAIWVYSWNINMWMCQWLAYLQKSLVTSTNFIISAFSVASFNLYEFRNSYVIIMIALFLFY